MPLKNLEPLVYCIGIRQNLPKYRYMNWAGNFQHISTVSVKQTVYQELFWLILVPILRTPLPDPFLENLLIKFPINAKNASKY
jgi:hypothetical protein